MRTDYKVLGDYIEIVDDRNRDLSITNLLGVSISKKFIPSIANIVGTDSVSYTHLLTLCRQQREVSIRGIRTNPMELKTLNILSSVESVSYTHLRRCQS